MSKSLAAIVDTETEEVVWYAVADDEVAEDLLDEAAEKYKTKTDDNATDLADELRLEDEKYDYTVIPLDEGETPESVFEQMEWKTKSIED